MSYRRTHPEIEFSLIDTTAKSDMTVSADNQSFADLDILKTNNEFADIYMTFELNYSVLTGELSEFTEDTSKNKYGYYSLYHSNSDCLFTNNPKLTFEFSSNHSSQGLTLTFGGYNLPKYFVIRWYSASGALIYWDDYYPNTGIFYCKGAVSNYKKIEIEFISTMFPYNYIKLTNIEFGIKYDWTDKSIISAELFEETDITCNTLAIDTFDFTLYSEDDDFNILNPQGIYDKLQSDQPIKVYETIETYDDGNNLIESTMLYIGTFYLKEWSSKANNEISFSCTDAIGLLDKNKFIDGRFYSGDTPSISTVEAIITSIMNSAGITEYEIADNLKSITLYGYLPIMTHREALHQILFAIGAVASCSRSDKIEIYVPPDTISKTIEETNHLQGDEVKLQPYVSSIQLGINDLEVKPNIEIYNDHVTVGTHRIILSNPIFVNSSSPAINSGSTCTATIVSGVHDHFNYFDVNVTSAGTLIINGYPQERYSVNYKKTSEISSGETEKTLEIPDNLFINGYNDNVDSTAERLLEYYSFRNSATCNIICTDETPGQWILIKSQYGDMIKANILNMKTDLSKGFLSTVTLVCYSALSRYNYTYYAGSNSSTSVSELYGNTSIGLI